MTVLVTGAAGFIGVPLVGELLRRGERVVALDDFSVGDPERLEEVPEHDGLRIVEADVRDGDAVRLAVADEPPRAVVHLAARHFIPWCVAHPEETRAVNVEGTRNVLAAAAGAERLLFASTGDVYPPAEAPHVETDPTGAPGVYGESKLEGERLVATHTSACSLRLFNVYGPGDPNAHVLASVFEQLRHGDTLRLGNLGSRRDYVFVEDVVAVFAALLELPEAVGQLNVGSGETWSVEELVEQLRRVTGRPLEVQVDPDRVRATDRPLLAADIGRLRALLPELRLTSIEPGLRRTLAAEGLLPG
jgi:UDP-glucose 4-epimerase